VIIGIRPLAAGWLFHPTLPYWKLIIIYFFRDLISFTVLDELEGFVSFIIEGYYNVPLKNLWIRVLKREDLEAIVKIERGYDQLGVEDLDSFTLIFNFSSG